MEGTEGKRATVADLLRPRLTEHECQIEGVGTVVYRSLSRDEVLRGQKMIEGTAHTIEQFMISTALVDPKMTMQEVAAWQTISPAGEMEELTRVIQKASRMGPGATQEAYKSAGE